MTISAKKQTKAYKLSDLIRHYEIYNRAEGKSPKTFIWYSANLWRFPKWPAPNNCTTCHVSTGISWRCPLFCTSNSETYCLLANQVLRSSEFQRA